jgi:hypothetical protein
MSLQISRLHSGGLITNYYCSSACRHCLYRCSPAWPKDYITAETACACLQTIRQLGCQEIHIGGGEPCLQPDALCLVLDIARELGVFVEYVETNSAWFRMPQEARKLLERLQQHGLQTLLVSVSPFHNEYIPLYKINGVLEACRQTGVGVFPWIAEFLHDLSAFDEQQPHRLAEYTAHFGDRYVPSLPQRYWISPGGRALETFGQFAPHRSAAAIVADQPYGCRELSGVSHFHLDLYGNYIPGLCAGFAIRHTDLGQPLVPEDYPLLSRAATHGIGAVLEYACTNYDFQPDAQGYASKCHLCYAIRHFLVMERRLDFTELQPRGHYWYA